MNIIQLLFKYVNDSHIILNINNKYSLRDDYHEK